MSRKHENFSTITTVPTDIDPWSVDYSSARDPFADPFAQGREPVYPPSQEVADWAAQADTLRPGSDPFSPRSQETFASPENTAERPRNVLQKFGNKIVELSGMVSGGLSRGAEAAGRASNFIGKMAPGSRLHNTLNTAGDYMGTGVQAANGIGNVYTAASSAWNSREQVAQSALDYGRGAGMRVAGAGAQAAMDVIAKRTGVSAEQGDDGKNKLKIRKAKLARFALKVAFTGAAVIPKVGIEAGLAARKAVKKGAIGEYKAAKQQGVDMARDIAFTGYDPFARTGNNTAAAGVGNYDNNSW